LVGKPGISSSLPNPLRDHFFLEQRPRLVISSAAGRHFSCRIRSCALFASRRVLRDETVGLRRETAVPSRTICVRDEISLLLHWPLPDGGNHQRNVVAKFEKLAQTGEPDGSPGLCVKRQVRLQKKRHLNAVEGECQQARQEVVGRFSDATRYAKNGSCNYLGWNSQTMRALRSGLSQSVKAFRFS